MTLQHSMAPRVFRIQFLVITARNLVSSPPPAPLPLRPLPLLPLLPLPPPLLPLLLLSPRRLSLCSRCSGAT